MLLLAIIGAYPQAASASLKAQGQRPLLLLCHSWSGLSFNFLAGIWIQRPLAGITMTWEYS